jgi:hemoglobin
VSEASFFERVGGAPTFKALVTNFYKEVEANPILRPMYPQDDLAGAADRLQLFLEQYWGGPDTYSKTRGHPRLRMRHAQFYIATPEHDAWLACMHKAIINTDIAENLREELWEYFQYAAHSMKNAPDN